MAHNMHNYTSAPIYMQIILYAVSFHLIQIVGIVPNKHTNTIGEDITSQSRVINKMNAGKHDQIWTHAPKYFKNVCSSSTFNMHVHVVSSIIMYTYKIIMYTCKIITYTCILNYVYVQDNYVYLQDNYVYIIT